jgi:hypothetical protein
MQCDNETRDAGVMRLTLRVQDEVYTKHSTTPTTIVAKPNVVSSPTSKSTTSIHITNAPTTGAEFNPSGTLCIAAAPKTKQSALPPSLICKVRASSRHRGQLPTGTCCVDLGAHQTRRASDGLCEMLRHLSCVNSLSVKHRGAILSTCQTRCAHTFLRQLPTGTCCVNLGAHQTGCEGFFFAHLSAHSAPCR